MLLKDEETYTLELTRHSQFKGREHGTYTMEPGNATVYRA